MSYRLAACSAAQFTACKARRAHKSTCLRKVPVARRTDGAAGRSFPTCPISRDTEALDDGPAPCACTPLTSKWKATKQKNNLFALPKPNNLLSSRTKKAKGIPEQKPQSRVSETTLRQTQEGRNAVMALRWTAAGMIEAHGLPPV
jgi:hypothetical protein